MVYIANFLHRTHQESDTEAERRYGEFSMVVESDTKERAIQLFRDKISELRRNSDFFEGHCTIYFNQLLEFENFPSAEAALLGFKSVAGDPVMPFIGCSVPTAESDNCKIYNWGQDGPAADGTGNRLFIEFKK